MGLDAIVYRNKENLQLGADEPLAVVLDTGQVHFDDVAAERRHAENSQAAHVRFGNIALISALREEIARIAGPQSLLYTKVLYSGSHSGDFIPTAQLARLSEEISAVRRANKQSPELHHFLDDLEELVHAALHERNPIAFV